MKDNVLIEKKKQKLIELTTGFCDAYLDNDYKQLCEKLILKMSRKHNVPFLRGRLEIWAAAIVHAIGSINFLFDRSFKPYSSIKEISDHFGAVQSTISQKAKQIRDMFKMRYYDKEFSTSYMKEKNPFSDLVLINGIPYYKKSLPPNLIKFMDSFQSENDLTKKYKKYRNLSNNLVYKIINTYIHDDVLLKAGTLLGIAKGNQLILNSIEEKNALIDFTLFDFKTKNKCFLELFKNKIDKNEKEIMENLLSSYTSLFIIKNIFVREHVLILDDLLNNHNNNLQLIDINLSLTSIPGTLLFTRLIPFNDYKITSGVNFAFLNNLKEDLIKNYKVLSDKIKYDDPAIKRFITFFKLNRINGIKIISRDV